MWRTNLKISLVLIAVVACSGSLADQDSPYVAFSLREAQRRAQTDNDGSEELRRLGGITRIIGMVHDRDHQDVILVGRKIAGQPKASLDDLILALRTRLLHDEWPMVSIDPQPNSLKQKVSFRGHIANTAFGKDFLDCDIFLKKYSLQLTSEIDAVPAYKTLYLNTIKDQIAAEGVAIQQMQWITPDASQRLKGRKQQSSESLFTRFWFYPQEPIHFKAPGDVFCIQELQLGVSVEIASSDQIKQRSALSGKLAAAAEEFAQQFSAHYPEMTKAFPRLKRLKILYDLIAVADGIKKMNNAPGFDYFLHDYEISPVNTRDQYDLMQLIAVIDRSDGLQQAIQISGGIGFETQLKWLNYGDVEPLKEIVLRTRPDTDALTWPLPLQVWKMPNSRDLSPDDLRIIDIFAGTKGANRPGFALDTQSYILDPGKIGDSDDTRYFSGFLPPPPPPPLSSVDLGGIDIAIKLAFEKANLDTVKKHILERRTSRDSLFWDIKKNKRD